MANYGFKYIGLDKWAEFNRNTQTLDKDLWKGANKGQQVVVQTLHKLVKGHLRNQDLSWEPLSYSYMMRKKQNADMTLVAKWRYYNAIGIFNTAKGTWSVGVRRDLYYRSKKTGSKIRMDIIAYMHEYGGTVWRGRHLPARPLWRPSIEELNMVGIDNLIMQSIQRQLKTKGWKMIAKKLRKYNAPTSI